MGIGPIAYNSQCELQSDSMHGCLIYYSATKHIHPTSYLYSLFIQVPSKCILGECFSVQSFVAYNAMGFRACIMDHTIRTHSHKSHGGEANCPFNQ